MVGFCLDYRQFTAGPYRWFTCGCGGPYRRSLPLVYRRLRRSLPPVLTGSLPPAAAGLLAVLIITTRLPTLASNYGGIIICICVIVVVVIVIVVVVVIIFRRHIRCGKICRAGVHRHIYRRCLLRCK